MRRAAVLLLLVCTACQDSTPSARAFRATNRSQLIGGVAAVADVGDFVLENDKVRVAILGGHGSPGPGIYGGSLADADLQRTDPGFRGGNGLDAFSELFPMVNLATPNPDSTSVTVSASGEDGEAVVTVEAASDNYMDALEMLESLFRVPMDVQVRTDYRLRPGSRVVRIDSELVFNSSMAPDEVTPMAALSSPPDVFGTILRVSAAPTAPGAVAGDFLFYGNKTSVFTPGYGFDFESKLREIFNSGCDTINVPVGVDAIAAEAEGVSYAYASAAPDGGKTFVPLFASSFTAVMTHMNECTSSANCLNNKRFGYSRLFAIGDGDAASALAAIYEERGIETGTISGHLFDDHSRSPVSGARILVIRDPGGEHISDAELLSLPVEESLARIYEANRVGTRRLCTEADPTECERCSASLDPFGEPGIVTSMKSDRRADDKIKDGDFEAKLPAGKYLLVARDADRSTARPVRVSVTAGGTTEVKLGIEPPARLEVRVFDERGLPMPAKVTFGRCLPECATDGDCGGENVCDPTQRRCVPKSGCEGDACTCITDKAIDVGLGDALMPDNIQNTAFAGADGVAHISARPGEWELIVSRGPEYDIARHKVRLDPRRATKLDTQLHRVVDSSGWISADFHVHGINSHDANIDHDTRVLSMMGEGIELVSSSDHDAITDFAPAIRRLGAERFIKSQVGLETTTVELGHFIGAPLRFDQLTTGPNLIDGVDSVLTRDPNVLAGRAGAIDWDGLPPGAAYFCDRNGDGVFDRFEERLVSVANAGSCGSLDAVPEPGMMGRLRQLGLFGPRETVITVAHPRDGFFGYFDQFALSPFDLTLASTGSTLELLNPMVKPEFFDTDFDAIELFNGKRLDFVRTPTISEIAGFNRAMTELRSLGLPNAELERRQGELGNEWVRKVVSRTQSEQSKLMASPGTQACQPVECGEGVTGSCGAALDDEPCIEYKGIVDDWFRLLNGGVKVTGLGNSDTHGLMSVESGLPRNWVRSGTDEPRAIDIGEIAKETRAQGVVTSYGPFIRLDVNGTPIGGTLSKPSGAVKVKVSVESPLWFDVDRLELYRNGQLWKEVEAGTIVAECPIVDGVPNRQIVNFDCTFEDPGSEDAWYVAIAMGLRGKDLRPVYTSVPILQLEIGDITGRAFDAIEGFPVSVGRPEVPRQHPVLPFALTNPVWVDRAGDGFDAPVPLHPASPFAAKGSGQFPLSGIEVGRSPVEFEVEPASSRLVREFHRRLERALHSHGGHSSSGH